MVQKLHFAGRMIFRWRRKGSALFIRWKLPGRQMTVIRFPMMIIPMWIYHVGRSGYNEQGNNEQAYIRQIFFWFKKPW